MTTARFFLQAAAVAGALLTCAAFGSHAGLPIQIASAPNAVSRIVCDPPTFQNCHRMEGVTTPRVIHSETPAYPATAHSIAESVPAPHPNAAIQAAIQMVKSAVACVKKFRFVAATMDGKPVATQIKVKMNFHRTAEK